MLAALPVPFFISAPLIRCSKMDWDKLLQVHIVSSQGKCSPLPSVCALLEGRSLQGVCGQYMGCDHCSLCCSCCAQSCGIVGRKKEV